MRLVFLLAGIAQPSNTCRPHNSAFWVGVDLAISLNMEDVISRLTVQLEADGNVTFSEREDDLPVFSRSWSFFSDETLKAIAAHGVTATLGPSDRRYSRLLRMRTRDGRIFFEESLVVYV